MCSVLTRTSTCLDEKFFSFSILSLNNVAFLRFLKLVSIVSEVKERTCLFHRVPFMSTGNNETFTS